MAESNSASKLEKLEFDLYGILDLSIDCSKEEIVKAWRKKALTCHPDKNPDDASAAEKFLRISKALELLTCDKTRAAYDRLQKAKKAAEARTKQLDIKRRKLKEELEAREQASLQTKSSEKDAAKKLQEETERLRKEGSSLLRFEMENFSKYARNLETERADEDGTEKGRLKVRWKKDCPVGYTELCLRDLLSKYGTINALVYKQGSSLVEFNSVADAIRAFEHEHGVEGNPLKFSWIGGSPQNVPPPVVPLPTPMLDADFESFEESILRKLQQKEIEKSSKQVES